MAVHALTAKCSGNEMFRLEMGGHRAWSVVRRDEASTYLLPVGELFNPPPSVGFLHIPPQIFQSNFKMCLAKSDFSLFGLIKCTIIKTIFQNLVEYLPKHCLTTRCRKMPASINIITNEGFIVPGMHF